jgi:hypothetical protein
MSQLLEEFFQLSTLRIGWREAQKVTGRYTDIKLQIEDEMDPDCKLEGMKVCQKLCHDVSI